MLEPDFEIESLESYKLILDQLMLPASDLECNLKKELKHKTSIEVLGQCLVCNSQESFIVDLQYQLPQLVAACEPNWRERLVCKGCHLNNRQRLMASLMQEEMNTQLKTKCYMMEQVTPIYKWSVEKFGSDRIVGSEFLGPSFSSGDHNSGIRHEDVTNLSFESDTFDLILSNDVFEHVPQYQTAFSECYRVLRKGGKLFMTIPFHLNSEKSILRARVENGNIINILPEQYHGNPVSEEGSLVFTDFGWDLFPEILKAGFISCKMLFFRSEKHGHLGGFQNLFVAVK